MEGNVLPDEKYLSSEHERESDSIRNIIEENDEIYEDINYMETYDELKNNQDRKDFLQEFQDEMDRQEEHERKKKENKLIREKERQDTA